MENKFQKARREVRNEIEATLGEGWEYSTSEIENCFSAVAYRKIDFEFYAFCKIRTVRRYKLFAIDLSGELPQWKLIDERRSTNIGSFYLGKIENGTMKYRNGTVGKIYRFKGGD